MAYRIKVQDGIISYSATDPDDLVTYDIHGTLNVSAKINIGEYDSPISTISSNKDIVIDSGSIGSVRIEPASGLIFLNGVSWPRATTGPEPGMYIGASASNTLEYRRFIGGSVLSDNETSSSLSILFPDAQPGESVSGPSVLYTYVGPADGWRTLGFGQIIVGVVDSNTLTSAELEAIFSGAQTGQIVIGPDVIYICVPSGWRRVGTPDNEGLLRINPRTEDYTLEISDSKNTLISVDSENPVTIFLPAELPVGSMVFIGRNGTGPVVISGGPDVEVKTPDGYSISKIYGKVTAIKVSGNIWEIDGSLDSAIPLEPPIVEF